MTLPGVSVVTAIALLGAIGDVTRFRRRGSSSAISGWIPRVRQSGNEPAKHGKISKQGPGEVRGLLVEAAWQRAADRRAAARLPPARRRATRRATIATVAVARKLVVIAWHLLSRGEDYAFMRPALYREKIRRLELMLGAPRHQAAAAPAARCSSPDSAEPRRALVAQHEAAYRRLVADWQASRPATKAGAGATPGRASQRPSKGKAARQATSPEVCASLRQSPAPTTSFAKETHPSRPT